MRAKERGFTLIEILVVIVIIGITLGFALLSFGDFGASRRAVVNAEQLSAYIKLVQQRAIVENTAMGISVKPGGYTTFRYEKGLWQPMSAKSVFHGRLFPSNLVVHVQRNSKIMDKGPNIIIDASGNLNEFVINFGTEQKPIIASLISQAKGQLLIRKNQRE